MCIDHPGALSGAAVALNKDDRNAFLFGGASSLGVTTSNLWVFDIDTFVWGLLFSSSGYACLFLIVFSHYWRPTVIRTGEYPKEKRRGGPSFYPGNRMHAGASFINGSVYIFGGTEGRMFLFLHYITQYINYY